jgi:hypothetical protein
VKLTTGEQCQLKNISDGVYAPSAEVFNGIPVFCGGRSNFGAEKKCYKLNKVDNSWEQVKLLFSFVKVTLKKHILKVNFISFLDQ